jgi:MYXO-CTERM domain-containing protein
MRSREQKRRGRASLAITFALLAPLLSFSAARAETFFVAPGGSDQNPGSEVRPFATMAKGQASAGPGDTVYFRAGTYRYTSGTAADGVVLSKSGQSGRPIVYAAYADEQPVFDFAGMTAKQRITGIRVTGSFIHLKGLELKGVPQRINTANESWGIYNLGNNNLYERLNLHHIAGPGLFIGGGSNNVVLNCDSHDNYDPLSKAGAGENADGFGCHGNGTNNVFRGCRAWWNTDDGYDFISAKGVCIVENSWAFYNGYMPGTFTAKKNGNGFKAGGFGLDLAKVPANPPRHTVRNCLAFRNLAAGFYANHHPIGGDWYNNTGYKNARDFDMLVLEQGGRSTHKMRNNVGLGSGTLVANWKGGDNQFNAWTLGLTVTEADFQRVDMKGVDGPRGPDGSLPDLPFMKLRPGSKLIDRGQNVGLKFSGAAPDLGWHESGTPLRSEAAGTLSEEVREPIDDADALEAAEALGGCSVGGDAGAAGARWALGGLVFLWVRARRRRD